VCGLWGLVFVCVHILSPVVVVVVVGKVGSPFCDSEEELQLIR
jgi:hypothetical protein